MPISTVVEDMLLEAGVPEEQVLDARALAGESLFAVYYDELRVALATFYTEKEADDFADMLTAECERARNRYQQEVAHLAGLASVSANFSYTRAEALRVVGLQLLDAHTVRVGEHEFPPESETRSILGPVFSVVEFKLPRHNPIPVVPERRQLLGQKRLRRMLEAEQDRLGP